MPHSAEEAARLLLGLGPDDKDVETLDRVRSLKTKAAAFDVLRALLGEVQARLERDVATFQQRDAIDRLGAAAARACASTCRSRATIVRFAREHAEAGHHDRAIALLRGDIPGPARP